MTWAKCPSCHIILEAPDLHVTSVPYLLVKERWPVPPVWSYYFSLYLLYSWEWVTKFRVLSRGWINWTFYGENIYIYLRFCVRESLPLCLHLFVYSTIYLYKLWIYFILWMIIQCYLIYIVAQVVLAIGSCFSWACVFPFLKVIFHLEFL